MTLRIASTLSTLVVLLAASACGEGVLIDRQRGSTGANGGDASSSVASAAGGFGGALNGGGGSEGGFGGSDNTGGATQGGGASSPTCTSNSDCPMPASLCVVPVCNNGVCATENIASGTLVAKDEPADCHATICDGFGNTVSEVDVDNPPPSGDACLTTACDPSGATVTSPSAAGVACVSASMAEVCDGAGHCVQCLSDSDCPEGQSCGATNTCTGGSGSCTDGKKDGNETDVDCGGSCPPCPLTKDCAVDQDCLSQLFCDAYVPHRCIADHCADHHTSGDETDIDCGGSCAKCADSYHCKVDQDCQSDDCDPTRDFTCRPVWCHDGVQDQGETDIDCGGGECDGCALGQKCFAFFDCLSLACDAISLTCVSDPCIDHQFDGDETDVDCGGPNTCARCGVGQECKSDSDCLSGLSCNPGIPHLCM